MKFIIINNFKLAAKRCAGLTKQAYEALACDHLESIVQHAVKNEARIVFTSDWLSGISDSTAYKLVSLLAKTSGVYAIDGALEIDADAMDALSIIGVRSSAQAGKVTLLSAEGGLTFTRDGGEGISIVLSLLPTAMGSSHNAVVLVEVSKRGRSAVKVSIEDLALATHEAQLTEPNLPVTTLRQTESEFVKKLRTHLSAASSNDKGQSKLEDRVLQKISEKGLSEEARVYVNNLLTAIQ